MWTRRHACTFSADSHGSCVSEAHGRKKVTSTAGWTHVWTTDPTCVCRTTSAHFTLARNNKAADNSRKKSSIECLKKPPKSKLHRFFQLANSKYLWTEHFLSGRKENCVCVCLLMTHTGPVLIPWAYASFHLISATILDKAHLSNIYAVNCLLLRLLAGGVRHFQPLQTLLWLQMMESLQIGHIYSSELRINIAMI